MQVLPSLFVGRLAELEHWRRWSTSVGLAFGLVDGATIPAIARDIKHSEAAAHEDVESFYGDAQQHTAIQPPGFRGLEADISLRNRSSRHDDPQGGGALDWFSTIEAVSPHRGTPNHNSDDICILDGQELVACTAGIVSPSCDSGGTHVTKIESDLRIKLDEVANTWEIRNPMGVKITLAPVIGEGTAPYSFAATHRWAASAISDSHDNTISYSWFNGDGGAEPQAIFHNGNEDECCRAPHTASYSTAIGPNGIITTSLRLNSIDIHAGGQQVQAYGLTCGALLATTEEEPLASEQSYGEHAMLDVKGNVVPMELLGPCDPEEEESSRPADFGSGSHARDPRNLSNPGPWKRGRRKVW